MEGEEERGSREGEGMEGGGKGVRKRGKAKRGGGVVRTKQKQGGRREVKGSNTIYKLICFGVVTML